MYQKFVETSLGFLSKNEQDLLLESIKESPSLAQRYNIFKKQNPISNVPWCSQASYVIDRPVFTLDPSFHAGAYYVQEPSSMFLEMAYKQITLDKNATILDLCASPGGKSTHLLSLMEPSQLLVCNEIIKNRIAPLKENLIKWGCENFVITSNDSAHFEKMGAIFDLAVVDAPCSGEGMFRKDADAINHWSPENVEICWKRQRRILQEIEPTIKAGGHIIYSTCTYNELEDEQNIAWFCKNFGYQEIKIDHNFEGILSCDFGYKFLPSKIHGEGFYLCLLQKTAEGNNKIFGKSRKSNLEIFKKKELLENYFIEGTKFEYFTFGETIKALQPNHKAIIDYLGQYLHIITTGLDVAQWLKFREIIPEHALCLNRYFDKLALDPVELPLPQALLFLKKELNDIDCNNGLHIATYEGLALGIFKKINNRINNQYPPEWRIRMALV